jgi:hypothetical protein
MSNEFPIVVQTETKCFAKYGVGLPWIHIQANLPKKPLLLHGFGHNPVEDTEPPVFQLGWFMSYLIIATISVSTALLGFLLPALLVGFAETMYVFACAICSGVCALVALLFLFAADGVLFGTGYSARAMALLSRLHRKGK